MFRTLLPIRIGYHRSRRLREQLMPLFLFLALMAGFAFTVVVVITASQDSPPRMPGWELPGSQPARAPFGFEMGGVAMGDTPKAVAAAYPEAQLTHGPGGLPVAAFSRHGAAYQVSFMGPTHQRRAFRIRYHQVFEDLGPEQALARIRDRFGQPAMGGCNLTLMAGSGLECSYTWWLEDSNRLDLLARSGRSDAGVPRTAITMTAVNTYLEGKMVRSLNRDEPLGLAPAGRPDR